MPHNSHSSHSRHGGSSSDDLGSTDEVKIFKDEGDREEEKISSENLLEEKSSLIDLTESEEKSGKLPTRPDLSPVFSKLESHAPSFNMGYLVSPYSYSNGGAGGLPVTMLHLSRRNRCEVAGRRASLSTTLTRTRQEVLVQAQAQAADTLSATNIVDAWWIHRDKAEGATQSTHSVIATQKLTARCSLLRTIEELWALCQR